MAALGVTTVECKSGYGLDRDTELRLLESTSASPRRRPPGSCRHFSLRTSCRSSTGTPRRLRAPGGRRDHPDAARDTWPNSATSSSRLGVHHRRSAGHPQGRRAAGLRPKLHADQLSAGGGAELAGEVGALSADHLEHITEAGIAALAAAGIVAVSLPLATLYLNQPPMPARRLIDAGVAVAVATDFNPGSAPTFHLPFALMLACTLQRMTPAEALKGATLYAARALGREAEVGSLEAGKYADFAVLDAPDVTQWLYHLQANACVRTVIGGETVWHS